MRKLVAVAVVLVALSAGTTLAKTTEGGGSTQTANAATTQYNNGGQGCTPGYWKNHTSSWSGYSPNDLFNTVFGVNYTPGLTLHGATQLNGGGFAALARHAASALLNAAHPDVSYGMDTDEVIAAVQQAFATNDPEPTKNLFDSLNNAGCSIDAQGRPIP
jgi:hypothetical protein